MRNKLALIGNKIEENKGTVSHAVLDQHFEISPEFKDRYSERHIKLYLEDCEYKLSYLAESVRLSQPELYIEYMRWAKLFFSSLGIIDDEFYRFFDILRAKLKDFLTEEEFRSVSKIYDQGLAAFKDNIHHDFSYFSEENQLKSQAQEFLNLLIAGDRRSAMNLIMNLYHSGTTIKDIYLNIFQPSLLETGLLWQTGKINVAQEHFVTAATQLIMSQLYPFMFTKSNSTNKKIIVCCVPNELHEIGARMVADLFEMNGWDSYFYGANTPLQSIMQSINNHNVQILAISATMTFHIKEMENIIQHIRNTSGFEDIKILVGGYPFKIAKNLWKEIGADGFAEDANGAIELANRFLIN